MFVHAVSAALFYGVSWSVEKEWFSNSYSTSWCSLHLSSLNFRRWSVPRKDTTGAEVSPFRCNPAPRDQATYRSTSLLFCQAQRCLMSMWCGASMHTSVCGHYWLKIHQAICWDIQKFFFCLKVWSLQDSRSIVIHSFVHFIDQRHP
jgi:hypothetical protein